MEAKYPNKYDRVLKNVFLFAGAEKSLEKALNSGRAEFAQYDPGDIIYDRGHYKKCLGVMLSGSATVSKESGGRRILMSTLFPGQVFGAAALFHDYGYYATQIQANEKTDVLFFPEDLLAELFEADFTLARNYINYLSGRIFFLSRKIDAFTGATAKARLATYLLDNMHEIGGKNVVTLPCSITQLTHILNLSRPTMHRVLEELSRDGIIERKRRNIAILDAKRLASHDNE